MPNSSMGYSDATDPFTGQVSTTAIRRDSDGALVPNDVNNVDWQAYQNWLAAGNTPTPPAAPAPIAPQFTFLQFLGMFTSSEQSAIVQSTDANVKLFLLMAAGAAFVSLTDPRTTQGLAYLVSINLITQDRETAILAGQAPAAS